MRVYIYLCACVYITIYRYATLYLYIHIYGESFLCFHTTVWHAQLGLSAMSVTPGSWIVILIKFSHFMVSCLFYRGVTSIIAVKKYIYIKKNLIFFFFFLFKSQLLNVYFTTFHVSLSTVNILCASQSEVTMLILLPCTLLCKCTVAMSEGM